MKVGFRIIALAFALLSATAEATKLHARGETYTIAPATSDDLNRQDYFGVYEFPFDLTGGTRLSLFPNHQFVISSWSDIGIHDFLDAYGTFSIHDAHLKLDTSNVSDERRDSLKLFSGLKLAYGYVQKGDITYDQRYFLVPDVEWKKLDHGQKMFNFLCLATPYYDWESILHELKQLKPLPKPEHSPLASQIPPHLAGSNSPTPERLKRH